MINNLFNVLFNIAGLIGIGYAIWWIIQKILESIPERFL